PVRQSLVVYRGEIEPPEPSAPVQAKTEESARETMAEPVPAKNVSPTKAAPDPEEMNPNVGLKDLDAASDETSRSHEIGSLKGTIDSTPPHEKRLSLPPITSGTQSVRIEINGTPWPDQQSKLVDIVDDHVYISMEKSLVSRIGAVQSEELKDGWQASMPASNVHHGVGINLSCSNQNDCKVISEYRNENRPVYQKGNLWLFPLRFLFESLGSSVQWEGGRIQIGASRFALHDLKVAFGEGQKTLSSADYYLSPDGRIFVSIDFLRLGVLKEELVKSPKATDFAFTKKMGSMARRVTVHSSNRRGYESLLFQDGESKVVKKPVRMTGLPTNRTDKQMGVPLRETLEALGFKVKWDNAVKALSIS
ncbi:hypothetical protein HZB08_01980, partial [Candidatus Saganbacteria bacterium]|nr:hypothetical protein [Candidatus Saganbacteria bacterium]